MMAFLWGIKSPGVGLLGNHEEHLSTNGLLV